MDYSLDNGTLNITLNGNTIMRFNLDFLGEGDKESIEYWIENQDDIELDVRVDENHFSQWIYCDGDEVTFGLECNNSLNFMQVFLPKELAIKAFEKYLEFS